MNKKIIFSGLLLLALLLLFSFVSAVTTTTLTVDKLSEAIDDISDKGVITSEEISFTSNLPINDEERAIFLYRGSSTYRDNVNILDLTSDKLRSAEKFDFGKVMVIVGTDSWKDIFKATTLTTSHANFNSPSLNDLAGLTLIHEGDYYPLKNLLDGSTYEYIIAYGDDLFCEQTKSKAEILNFNDEDIFCVGDKDYVEFFRTSTAKTVVVSDNSYEAAVIATTIATSLSAPLLIEGQDSKDVIYSSLSRWYRTSSTNNYFSPTQENFKESHKPTLNLITVSDSASKVLSKKTETATHQLATRLADPSTQLIEILAQNPLDLYTKQEQLLDLDLRIRPGVKSFTEDMTKRFEDHLIIYNPLDWDANLCGHNYSEYLSSFQGVGSLAPSTFCKDSAIVPYYAAIYGGILLPLKGDSDVSKNKLVEYFSSLDLTQTENKNFGKTLDKFNYETPLTKNPVDILITKTLFGKTTTSSNILLNSVRAKISIFQTAAKKLADAFGNRRVDAIPDDNILFVSVIGNEKTIPFFYDDVNLEIQTGLYLLANNLGEAKKLFTGMTKVGWITGLTPGDTSALVNRNVLTGYLARNTFNRFYDKNQLNGKGELSIAFASATDSKYRLTDPFVWQDMSNKLSKKNVNITPLFLTKECSTNIQSSQDLKIKVPIQDLTLRDRTEITKPFSLEVTFKLADHHLTSEGISVISDFVEDLKVQSIFDAISIRLTANADYRGGDDSNLQLSIDRATEVEDELRRQGFEGTIESIGKGETEPKSLTEKLISEFKVNYPQVDETVFNLVSGAELTETYIDNIKLACVTKLNSIDSETKDLTEQYPCASVYEWLMAINRQVDFVVTLDETKIDIVVDETTEEKTVTISVDTITDVTDCTTGNFDYGDYDVFYYSGNKDFEGNLPGLNIEEQSSTKNNLLFFETDKDMLSNGVEPSLTLKLIREGARGVFATTSSTRSNQGRFFLDVLQREYDHSLFTGEMSSALFMDYILWMPPKYIVESCANTGVCDIPSDLLTRAQDRSEEKFRLVGSPLSIFLPSITYNGDKSDTEPVEELTENPNPMILFSAIEEDEIAFLKYFKDELIVKDLNQGAFDRLAKASSGDFTVQSAPISVFAKEKDAVSDTVSVKLLIASSEPVLVDATLVDLSSDFCLSTLSAVSSSFKSASLKIASKFNWNRGTANYDVHCPDPNPVRRLGQKIERIVQQNSRDGGKGNLDVGLSLKFTGRQVFSSSSNEHIRSGFDVGTCELVSDVSKFSALINIPGLKSQDVYVCNVEVPVFAPQETLLPADFETADLFYKDALVRFEVIEKPKSGDYSTSSTSSTIRLRYVYDYGAVYKNLNEEALENGLSLGTFVESAGQNSFVMDNGKIAFNIDASYFSPDIISVSEYNANYYLKLGEDVDFKPTEVSTWQNNPPFYYDSDKWFRGGVVTVFDSENPSDFSSGSLLDLNYLETSLNKNKQDWESYYSKVIQPDEHYSEENAKYSSSFKALVNDGITSPVDYQTYYPYDISARIWVQSELFEEGSILFTVPWEENNFYKLNPTTQEREPNILVSRTFEEEEFLSEIFEHLKSVDELKKLDLTADELISEYLAITIYPAFKLASTNLFADGSESEAVNLLADAVLGEGTLEMAGIVYSSLSEALDANAMDESGLNDLFQLQGGSEDMFVEITSSYSPSLVSDGLKEKTLNNAVEHFAHTVAKQDVLEHCYGGDAARLIGGFTHVAPILAALDDRSIDQLFEVFGKPTIYLS